MAPPQGRFGIGWLWLSFGFHRLELRSCRCPLDDGLRAKRKASFQTGSLPCQTRKRHHASHRQTEGTILLDGLIGTRETPVLASVALRTPAITKTATDSQVLSALQAHQ